VESDGVGDVAGAYGVVEYVVAGVVECVVDYVECDVWDW